MHRHSSLLIYVPSRRPVSDDELYFVCCIYLNTKYDFDGMKINIDDRPFLSVDCALSASVFDAPKFDQCGH